MLAYPSVTESICGKNYDVDMSNLVDYVSTSIFKLHGDNLH